jgi:isoleucyl-tRNA synthetase
VPIPALKCGTCGHVGLYDEVMRAAERIFESEGSDAWFSRPVGDFVAPALKCAKCEGTSFEKEEDVLDVWFDSGCSQAAVLGKRPELTWPADAYLEAVEQARGWFGSSLACAVAERGHAPFRAVISHGLTVDEQGRKMSKSLGNSEDAADAVNRIGADVLRLVYASLDYTTEIALGDTVYNAVAEAYRKIRNTCRYILGNLADFDPARDAVPQEHMTEFDCYILARLERLKSDVRRAFDDYDFQAAYHAIVNFVVVDLSSLYIDVARDRLYCAAAASAERRSVQTALYHVIDTLVRMLATLIPFTADEIYSHMPGAHAATVHLLTLALANPDWRDAELEARWDRLLKVRAEALKLLEAMRQAGTIGAPLEAAVSIGAAGADDGGLAETLASHRGTLKELFIVSQVAPLDPREAEELRRKSNGAEVFSVDGLYGRVSTDPPLIVVGRRAPGRKCQRCWMYFDDDSGSDLDPRCRAVVQALNA